MANIQKLQKLKIKLGSHIKSVYDRERGENRGALR